MFWHLILVLLSPLYLMFALLFRSDQARLVVAVRQQVLVLQRQLGKQPSLVKGERLALVLSGLLLARKRLGDALLIVKPETLVGWHRAIVRRHWRLLSRRRPGRPPEITPETRRGAGLGGTAVPEPVRARYKKAGPPLHLPKKRSDQFWHIAPVRGLRKRR